jgi:hypothetical protein
MSATAARLRLQSLTAERLDAVEAGLGVNATYMTALESEITATRNAYVMLAVTELASLRAALAGATLG